MTIVIKICSNEGGEDCQQLKGTQASLGTTVIAVTILLILSILFSRVTVNVLVLVLRVVGNQLYSSLSLLARQSMLLLTELPVFERFFQLEYSESYTCNMHGDARIEGYHYCIPLETLLALNYNSFILTVGIIGVDSHARDMYGNSHSQGTCVLLEIPYMQKLVQYFQSLYTCRNEDIYELKGVHIANFEVDLCSSSVEYCSISNVNSLYQCSCKQCCAIAVYAMRYSVVKIHVDTGLQELYLLVMGIHCTV